MSDGQVLTAQDGGSNLQGGAGDDTLIAGHGPDTLSGGAGADMFRFNAAPWSAGHVTDFTSGSDHIDLSGLFSAVHYTGSDPISDGYVKLIDDGHGNAWLYFDSDGHWSGDAYGSFVATLDHVAASQLHAADFGFAAAPPPPGAAKTFVVFAGQSNMGGLNQTPGTLPAGWQATPMVQIWNPQLHAWQEMQPGYNTGYPGFSSTWGPEVQFAIDFHAAHPNDVLYVVKSVSGGTALAANGGQDWSPQSPGELFDQTTAQVHAASAALGGMMPSALFWGQGEEDAAHQDEAAAYGSNLSAFFAAARSQWLDGPNASIGFFRIGDTPPYAGQVQSAELSVDAADAHATSFETSDYPHQGDALHLATAGLLKVGDQFYQLFSGWTGGPTSPPPPPPTSPPPPPPTSPPPPPGGGQVLTAQEGGSNLVGGSGNDTLIAAHGADTLTGGGGADVFRYGVIPWSPGHVTDFTAGTDKLDVSQLLAGAHYAGSDPIADGYVKLIDDGHGDAWLYFDTDGKGMADQWGSFIATLDHVAPGQVHASDLTGSGSPPPPPPTSPPPPPTSPPPPPSGGQVLQGQDGGSNLVGGAGDDTLIGGHGADTMTGAGGADHFVFKTLPWTAGHITDFVHGTDKLDVAGLLSAAGYAGGDPIADGYVKLIADGHGNTWLYFDRDGHGTADPWGTFVATFDHVAPGALSPGDFIVH